MVDYRALNKLTVKNRYPLPRIDDKHGSKHTYWNTREYLALMSKYIV